MNQPRKLDITPQKAATPDYVAGVAVPKPNLKWWQKLTPKVIYGLLVPIVLSAIYWGFWAADRYMSQTSVLIKDAGAVNGEMESLNIIGTLSPSQRDALLVKEYILSWNMLSYLDENLSLKEHYQTSGDFFSRLSGRASREDFLSYYKNYIDIEFVEMSSTLTIKFQAFDGETSEQVVNAIIEKSELFINQIGNKLAKEQMLFVENELERAKHSLTQAQLSLATFQGENKTYSPEQHSNAMANLINSLEAEIVKSEADFKEQAAYLVEDSPQLVAVRARINALQQQLAIEKDRLVGEGSAGGEINRVNAEYQDLILAIEFATDSYKAALSAYEQARIEAYQKLKHLVVVDPPVIPDSAEFPRRLYSLFTTIVVILIMYGLTIMIYATIKEHKDA